MGEEEITRAPGARFTAGLRRLPRVGEVVAEKYRIKQVLGQGGMGVVLAAHHLVLQHVVALKLMNPSRATSEVDAARFAREARAAARLKSEHAVRILDVDRLPSGAPYIVMEYLAGASFEKVLAERGAIPWAEAVPWIIQACKAIAEAHEHGIIHRDVKPENLFLTRSASAEPLVKVLDFGLAKCLDVVEAGHRTDASRRIGSPQYMSPEQILCARDLDHRTDIWSLGATLYELIANRPAFDGANVGVLFANIREGRPTPLREIRPEVPAALEAVIMRCLEQRPQHRFQTAHELAIALADAIARPNVLPCSGLCSGLTMPEIVHPSLEPDTIPMISSSKRERRRASPRLVGFGIAAICAFVIGAVGGIATTLASASGSEARNVPATCVVERPRQLVTKSAGSIARPPMPPTRGLRRSASSAAGDEPHRHNASAFM
jgi:eukaryotic-like serine/threonine-protein kinase